MWPGLAREDGTPLLLSEVTPRDLGVHVSRFGPEGNYPYIRRQADDLLAETLADLGKRLVIVEGPRLAGATTTLAQAAQACLPDHLAAGFADDPRVPVTEMITQAGQWVNDAGAEAAGAVVWLDGLSPDRFTELARVPLDDLPPGVRVLATLDTGELEGLRIPEQLNTMLDQHAVRVRLGTITQQERRALLAQDAYAALRPLLEEKEDLFLGRLMVAWEPLRAALSRGGSEQATDQAALLRAVTDWYRAYLPRLLSHDALSYLYRAYRRELTGAAPDSPVSAAGFSEALQWATTAPAADRPRLIDLQDVPGGQRYAPHPLLAVIADDPGEEVSWPISDVLWSYADRYFSGDQRRNIGYSALTRGARHAAARLLSHTDTTLDPEAYSQLAVLFYDHAEWASSRYWWQQAIAAGHPDQAPRAMVNLGLLDALQGDLGQARHWYQQAIATGHPDQAPRAMVNLGDLEDGQDDLGQARHWYQQAIATGHPDQAPRAMVNLGLLEAHQRDSDRARHRHPKAIPRSRLTAMPTRMLKLGVLEDDQGDFGQARRWYQQAIATGHPDQAPRAMVNLGLLDALQGELGQARHWYQQAIATGHPDQAPRAMVNLGLLEDGQDDLGQARHWYQQAIATGHPRSAPMAMLNLGGLEDGQDDLGQARHWYQQAIATGHRDVAPRAMVNLGDLEAFQGDLGQARHWYQQAIATGHPDDAPRAMVNLGALEALQGDLGQARHWYQQAIATGHPDDAPRAMVNLGLLERGRGDLGQARHWYQQAIATGHPESTSRAQEDLRAIDRHEKDRQRGEHFGRYGYLAYADPTLMKSGPTATHASEPDTDMSADDDAD